MQSQTLRQIFINQIQENIFANFAGVKYNVYNAEQAAI